MVTTRSGAGPKKIKFLDDSFNDVEYHTADEKTEEPHRASKASKEVQPESDSDSDDEAPEEESTSTTKAMIVEQEKQRKKAQEESLKQEKEKRRKLNDFHANQQKLKKISVVEKEELPEFLPEELIEDMIEQENASDEEDEKFARKHLKMSDFEDIERKELAQQVKAEKLKRAKQAKKTVVKKGVLRVKVSASEIRQVNKKLVPKSEARVVDARAKWLKRKSLSKK